MATKLIVTYNS